MRFIRLLMTGGAITAAALAATSTSTTITATLTAPAYNFTNTSLTFTGNVTLSGIGSGTMSATASVTSISSDPVVIPYTITLSGGTLKGNASIPLAVVLGSAMSGTGSVTVTSGTGNFAGYTGNFPSVSGTATGSLTSGLTINLSGAGTLTVGGPPPPTITQVLDAGSYTATVAQGGMFVAKGTGLSNSGFFQESFPLPTASSNSAAGGVSINFTPLGGGGATKAYLIYEYNQGGVNQLAAVLPSTVAASAYNVTVTANGQTSASFQVSVVKSKPSLFTADATGNGLSLVQNYVSASELDLDRFTTGTISGFTVSPAHPNQTLIAYATNFGAISGADNVAATASNLWGANTSAIIGGKTYPVAYAGPAPGFSALDQVNITLDASVQTGCAVPFQLVMGTLKSQSTFLSIAPTGANACSYPGVTTQQLTDLDNGKVYYGGNIGITQASVSAGGSTFNFDEASAVFYEYSGFELPAVPSTYFGNATPTSGCTVFPIPQTSSGGGGTGVAVALDAGTVTLNGPSGSGATNLALTEMSNIYSASLNGLPGGTYAVTGSGGVSVGPFNTSLTVASPLTITGGLPATITRANGLSLAWTGGNSSDSVTVIGEAVVSGVGAGFTCITTAGAKSINIASSILNQLPAVSSTSTTSSTFGGLSVITGNGTTFSAPLVGGGTISNATFGSAVQYANQPTYN